MVCQNEMNNILNIDNSKVIEENIKQLMPNALSMKKSRSSSSTFTVNNNYAKYNLNEFK